MVARESGYNQWNSFVYSFLMSTFYWEYGIEAVAEVSSTQDIIITPMGGWLYGEWAYHKKANIVANNGILWGSEDLGRAALLFLDPVDSIDKWINDDHEKPVIEDLQLSVTFAPTFYTHQNIDEDLDYLGLVMKFRI